MPEAQRKILGSTEKLGLAVAAVLVILGWFFGDLLRSHPLVSGGLFAALALLAVGYWLRRNYKMVDRPAKTPQELQDKLEGILVTMFQPLGYEILKTPQVDERQVSWAVLRDTQGIMVVVQYLEISVAKMISQEKIEQLVQRMNLESAPKGVYLTTGFFEQEALDFARSHNILTKDGDQLLEMIEKTEEGYQPGKEYFCRYCGSKLVLNREITGLMECKNPDCGKTASTIEELEEQEKSVPGDVQTFNITCYQCSRPVEIDTSMSGLMECPYEDCSWIINVDNELLALRGGHDKNVSERLAEIKCPKCEKMIKVPANAEGLMECPCEKKWIIDVGAALGERAQAQVAESMGEEDESGEEGAASGEEGRTPPAAGDKGVRFEPATAWEKKTYSLSRSGGDKTTSAEAGAGSGGVAEEAKPAADSVKSDHLQPDSQQAPEEAGGQRLELESSEPESSSPEADNQLMVDCPSCHAGVPAKLDECPVCHMPLKDNSGGNSHPLEFSGLSAPPPAMAAAPASGRVTHRHAYMSMNTAGLLIFFFISIVAFLIFVYFLTH